MSGTYVETAAGKTHTFAPRTVRYVRDYLNGSTANTGNHLRKSKWGNRTTVYVNALYEKDVSGNLSTKYYYLGGQRIAMRRGSTLTYLHGDHLGSASLATNASGTKITDSDTRYSPYGVTRPGLAGTGLPTDRRFTGQREEVSLGFYDYGARAVRSHAWDGLRRRIPSSRAGNPQSLNRYSHKPGNPLRYTGFQWSL